MAIMGIVGIMGTVVVDDDEYENKNEENENNEDENNNSQSSYYNNDKKIKNIPKSKPILINLVIKHNFL